MHQRTLGEFPIGPRALEECSTPPVERRSRCAGIGEPALFCLKCCRASLILCRSRKDGRPGQTLAQNKTTTTTAMFVQCCGDKRRNRISTKGPWRRFADLPAWALPEALLQEC